MGDLDRGPAVRSSWGIRPSEYDDTGAGRLVFYEDDAVSQFVDGSMQIRMGVGTVRDGALAQAETSVLASRLLMRYHEAVGSLLLAELECAGWSIVAGWDPKRTDAELLKRVATARDELIATHDAVVDFRRRQLQLSHEPSDQE